VTLRQDFEIVFTSGTTGPLYVDPAELQSLFPEAGYVEILEFVSYYSLEVEELLDGKPITLESQEYVKAATACALSRIYDYAGGLGGGDGTIRLGDLQIEGGRSASARAALTAGNASTWCQLAAALRADLTRGGLGAGMKAVVRGSNYPNPMPRRALPRTRAAIGPAIEYAEEPWTYDE
jgi:hypothetical protein